MGSLPSASSNAIFEQELPVNSPFIQTMVIHYISAFSEQVIFSCHCAWLLSVWVQVNPFYFMVTT